MVEVVILDRPTQAEALVHRWRWSHESASVQRDLASMQHHLDAITVVEFCDK